MRAANPIKEREMMRAAAAVCVVSLVLGESVMIAQTIRPVARPPAPAPGPPRPEDGSAAPDGYAPVPAWPGQTRAPKPERSASFTVDTVASGLTGAMSFAFLPDGR